LASSTDQRVLPSGSSPITANRSASSLMLASTRWTENDVPVRRLSAGQREATQRAVCTVFTEADVVGQPDQRPLHRPRDLRDRTAAGTDRLEVFTDRRSS